MKKYSVFAALLLVVGIAISSCSASARVGTKHHSVAAGTHIN